MSGSAPVLRGLPEPVLATARARTLVMGVVNVTPDSFSDGGLWLDPDAAVRHGLELVEQGADLVDVGGESTRPGAQRVDVEEELRRVLPVIGGLAAAGVPVSVDTMHSVVAERALDAGAVLVNDVSGGLADDAMPATVARAGAPFVAMHWRGPSSTMSGLANYDDVVTDVARELTERVHALVDAGVDVERLVLDPGLGFAKNAEHNWALLGRLDELHALGRPLLVGASRKRFLGSLLAGADGEPRPLSGREAATAATTVLAAMAGAWCVRVHDVPANADAVRVAAAARATDRAAAAAGKHR
jgi:dihydropteroate synthase